MIPSTLDGQLRLARARLDTELRAGGDPRAESLLLALPAVAADHDSALELVYTEYLLRQELGQKPTPEDWYARFPSWRADLEQMFQVHDALCRAETNLPTVSRSFANAPTDLEHPGLSWVPGYRIEEELGRGGMGVVYKATHTALNRAVALKVILSGQYASVRERDRFRREAEAAARLDHPNIVRVYEVGEADGRPYCAMEYVPGGSLADQLHGMPWPERRAAEVVAVLARALQHAHDRGIVHRDLKPANILLAVGSHDEGMQQFSSLPTAKCQLATTPKVADFGLAKLLSDSDAGPTRTGDIVGTPAYMAPEQIAGRAGGTGPAIDIWALGVLLYEMLTGHPPFQGESTAETLTQVRTVEPVPPRHLRARLSRDLQTICLKCLSKAPAGRYTSAAALADDLDRWLRGETIVARPVGLTIKVGRWCRRNPRVAALLTVFIGLLAGGSFVFASLWLDARAARIAEANASREKDLAIEGLERQRYGALVADAQKELDAGSPEGTRRVLDGTDPRFRNLEWDFLYRLSGNVTVNRPAFGIWYPAVHPDGRSVAFVETDGGFHLLRGHYLSSADARRIATLRRQPRRVQIREQPSNRLIREWTLQVGRVFGVGFADHGRRLLVTGDDPALSIWDTATGEPVRELPAVARDLSRLVAPPCPDAESPRYLAALAHDGRSILFWDASTGGSLPPLRLPAGQVLLSFVPSPDQSTFAATAQDASAKRVVRYRGRFAEGGPVATTTDLGVVAYDPAGRLALARGDVEDMLFLTDVATGDVLARLRTDGETRLEAAVGRDGRLVAAQLVDGAVSVWQLGDRADLGTPTAYQKPTRTFAASWLGGTFRTQLTGDGVLALTSMGGQSVSLFDQPGGGYRDLIAERPRVPSPPILPLPAVWFHADGRRLLAVGPRGFDLWDVQAGRLLHADHDPKRTMIGSVGAPSGERFAVHRLVTPAAGANPKVVTLLELWSTDPPRKLWEQELIGLSVASLGFTPGEAEVVAVLNTGGVRTYDCQTGAAREGCPGWEGSDMTTFLAPDADLLYTMRADQGSGGTVVSVTRTADGVEARRFVIPERTGRVGIARVLGQERLVVSSWTADAVQVWDAAGGKLLATLHGTAGVRVFDPTADGQRVVALGPSHVSVWNPVTGQKLLAFLGPPPTWGARGVAVSRDGGRIAVVGDQGQVRVWTTGRAALNTDTN